MVKPIPAPFAFLEKNELNEEKTPIDTEKQKKSLLRRKILLECTCNSLEFVI